MTSGPTPVPVYSHPFLGSHAQKLGCFVLALWLLGWHLPLAVPGFCLPEGSPDRRSTRGRAGGGEEGIALSLKSAFKTGMKSTVLLPDRPLQGHLTSPLCHQTFSLS